MTAEKPKSESHLAPASSKVKSVDFKNASAAPSSNTKSVGRKLAAGGAPELGVKANKTSTTKVRSGARYGIRVKFAKQVAPEAGSTQANGKIIAPATNRQRPNFSSGMGE